MGVKVIDRCNLTILEEPGQEDLAAFLASRQVEVVASLPVLHGGAGGPPARQGSLREERARHPEPERARLRARGLGARAQPRLQPAGREPAAGAGEARGGLQAHPGRGLRDRVQRALHARQHAHPALRLDAHLEGAVQRLHGAPARGAPRRERRGRDVPHARVRGLAGLRVRLRLQPDAGAAPARRGASPGRTSPTCSAATSRATRSSCATTATAAPRGRARPAAARSPDDAATSRRAAPVPRPTATRRACSTARPTSRRGRSTWSAGSTATSRRWRRSPPWPRGKRSR